MELPVILMHMKGNPENMQEDPYYEDLLYLGTDNGVYMSFDKGLSWNSFNNGLQKVATHDLVIQKRAKDLLIGTHGRSIYKMDLSIIYSFLEKRNLKQTISYKKLKSMKSGLFAYGGVLNNNKIYVK